MSMSAADDAPKGTFEQNYVIDHACQWSCSGLAFTRGSQTQIAGASFHIK